MQKDPLTEAISCFDILQPSPPGSVGLVLGHDDDIFFRKRSPKALQWSVPWSDLMMTMFILFVVLYVYQSANRQLFVQNHRSAQPSAADVTAVRSKSAPETAPAGQRDIADIFDRSRETITARYPQDAFVDLVKDRAVRIVLTGDLLFETGNADLKASARASLRELAEIIRQTPHTLNVVGHTDNTPIHSEKFPTNWELSVIRACVVARYLIEEMNIPADRFFVSGHSYFQPIKPNDTASNRTGNRRVEIIISKERPQGTPGDVPALLRLGSDGQ